MQGERTPNRSSFSTGETGGAAVDPSDPSSLDDFPELNITNEDDEVRGGSFD